MPTVQELAREILEDGLVMSLGVCDEDGPWVADVIYVAEDWDLYWVSMPDARHSKAIAKDSRVACTITASRATNDERALQISGTAEQVGDGFLTLAHRMEGRRGKPLPENESDFLSKGHVWYRLVPDHIYLMHSKEFGYERKRVFRMD